MGSGRDRATKAQALAEMPQSFFNMFVGFVAWPFADDGCERGLPVRGRFGNELAVAIP